MNLCTTVRHWVLPYAGWIQSTPTYFSCFLNITFKASLNNPEDVEFSRMRTHLLFHYRGCVSSPATRRVDFCRATHSYPHVRTSVPGPRAHLRVFSSRVPFPFPDDPLGSHPLSAACRHRQLFPFPKPTDCPSWDRSLISAYKHSYFVECQITINS